MFQKNRFFLIFLTLIFFITSLLTGCLFIPSGSLYVTSHPSGAEIFLNGTFYGKVTPSMISNLSPGSYLLRLTLENPSMNSEEQVIIFQNQVTSVHLELVPSSDYRALCIGINDYQDPVIQNLNAPSYDVARMREVFENSHFGDMQTPFAALNALIGAQATRSNVLQSIDSSFSAADNNDVSYFYFSGHGWSNGDATTILPYDAVASTSSQDISVDELASALGNIPGTKVVILDSCFSGGFIGKGFTARDTVSTDELRKFNESVIESFAFHDTLLAKGNLAAGEFKVIVSSSGNQKCLETLNHPIDGNPYGYFSASLCEGCGYNNFTFPAPADSNTDSRITLNEIYQYISFSLSDLQQDVQVYPQNSSFVFIEY